MPHMMLDCCTYCLQTGVIAVAHGSSRIVRTSQPPTYGQGQPLFPHPVLLPTGETAAWFASLSVCESGVHGNDEADGDDAGAK